MRTNGSTICTKKWIYLTILRRFSLLTNQIPWRVSGAKFYSIFLVLSQILYIRFQAVPVPVE